MSQKPTLSDNSQVFLILALIFGAMLVGSLLFLGIRPALGDFDPENFDGKDIKTGYLAATVSQVALFIVCVLLFLRIVRLKFTQVFSFGKLSYKFILISIAVLIVGLFAVELLSAANVWIIEQYPRSGWIEGMQENIELNRSLFNPERKELYPLALLLFGLLPGIVEELVFRGLLMKKLKDVSSGNVHFAVIVSALIFAAVHTQPWNLLPIAFMGVVLGYVYHYTKDIRYSMLIHFLFNAFSITAAFYFPEAIMT